MSTLGVGEISACKYRFERRGQPKKLCKTQVLPETFADYACMVGLVFNHHKGNKLYFFKNTFFFQFKICTPELRVVGFCVCLSTKVERTTRVGLCCVSVCSSRQESHDAFVSCKAQTTALSLPSLPLLVKG